MPAVEQVTILGCGMLIEVNKCLGKAHSCSYLPDSPKDVHHNHHSIEAFKDNMHSKFLQTSALLLKLVVETMIDAIITQKKWLNEAFTTQKLHRNHIHPIEPSTDGPILELMLNVAHADLEIPSTC